MAKLIPFPILAKIKTCINDFLESKNMKSLILYHNICDIPYYCDI